MGFSGGTRITCVSLVCIICLFLLSRESDWVKMESLTAIRNTTKSSRSVEHIDTALVILTAGRKDEENGLKTFNSC